MPSLLHVDQNNARLCTDGARRRLMGHAASCDTRKPDPSKKDDDHDGHTDSEHSKPYPPESIPCPMPGFDPQQSPGIDGPSPLSKPPAHS